MTDVRRSTSHAPASDADAPNDGAGRRRPDSRRPRTQPAPGSAPFDDGSVPEKQIWRWKDDGGALGPQS